VQQTQRRDRRRDRRACARLRHRLRLREAARRSASRAGLAVVLARLAAEAPVRARADPDEAIFRRDGDHWTLRFEGRTASVRDLAGLHLLRRLVAERGVALHVADLMGAAVGGGDAGACLDAAARASYRSRLATLGSELVEAEVRGDQGRSEQLRGERDAVRAALAAGFGVGGRARRTADPHERARKAAYRRIQLALERIATAHAPLARHLRAAVRTGTLCSYDPERPVRWQVD